MTTSYESERFLLCPACEGGVLIVGDPLEGTAHVTSQCNNPECEREYIWHLPEHQDGRDRRYFSELEIVTSLMHLHEFTEAAARAFVETLKQVQNAKVALKYFEGEEEGEE